MFYATQSILRPLSRTITSVAVLRGLSLYYERMQLIVVIVAILGTHFHISLAGLSRRTRPFTHEPITTTTNPFVHSCTTYSSTAVSTYSSINRCVPSSYAAQHGRVVKAPWVQKTKLQNTSTTHSHEHIRPPTHTRRPNHPSTHQPTHPRRATAILQYVQRDMRWYMPSLSLCRPGISFFLRLSATPGSERPVPGRARFQGPRSPWRSSAPVLSPGSPRADVWGGRGTIVVPRGVGWRSGVAAAFLGML